VLAVVGNRHIWCRGHGARSSLTRCNSSDDVVTMSWPHVTAQARRIAERPSSEWVNTVDDDDVGVQCLAPAARSAAWRRSGRSLLRRHAEGAAPDRGLIMGCAVDEPLDARRVRSREDMPMTRGGVNPHGSPAVGIRVGVRGRPGT
jgi:hypothetical protein